MDTQGALRVIPRPDGAKPVCIATQLGILALTHDCPVHHVVIRLVLRIICPATTPDHWPHKEFSGIPRGLWARHLLCVATQPCILASAHTGRLVLRTHPSDGKRLTIGRNGSASVGPEAHGEQGPKSVSAPQHNPVISPSTRLPVNHVSYLPGSAFISGAAPTHPFAAQGAPESAPAPQHNLRAQNLLRAATQPRNLARAHGSPVHHGITVTQQSNQLRFHSKQSGVPVA